MPCSCWRARLRLCSTPRRRPLLAAAVAAAQAISSGCYTMPHSDCCDHTCRHDLSPSSIALHMSCSTLAQGCDCSCRHDLSPFSIAQDMSCSRLALGCHVTSLPNNQVGSFMLIPGLASPSTRTTLWGWTAARPSSGGSRRGPGRRTAPTPSCGRWRLPPPSSGRELPREHSHRIRSQCMLGNVAMLDRLSEAMCFFSMWK